jgi:hypothetical protein
MRLGQLRLKGLDVGAQGSRLGGLEGDELRLHALHETGGEGGQLGCSRIDHILQLLILPL